MILRKIFGKNPELEKINNVFFKGAVIHTDSGEVVSEDKNEVLKIINLLNGYLNGNEFQGNMLEKILNALNVNISESYICSGVLYGLDKPEGINVQSSPNWGNERPREADLCFKFSNGIDLSTFYAVHIIPNEATIDLYQITGTSTTYSSCCS